MRSRPLGLKVGMVRVSEARPLENVFERGLRRHSIFTGPESNPLPASLERPGLLDHIRRSCGWMVGCNVGHECERLRWTLAGARLSWGLRFAGGEVAASPYAIPSTRDPSGSMTASCAGRESALPDVAFSGI